jgi:L-ascorbate metabolism protein UlaG (beta-lactamase superfamily)
MEIKYFGHSSFQIKNKYATIVTDPYDQNAIGIKFPKNIEANIVTVSHDHADHNSISNISGSPFVISEVGEYEVSGISFTGFTSFHDNEKGDKRGLNIIFKIEADGLNICHLGDLGHNLNDDELDRIDGVDILMIPVGGFYTIGSEDALKIIKEIEPSYVLPMHYGRSELDPKAFGSLVTLDKFLHDAGADTEIQKIPKLNVTKDKLPEKMQYVIFE